MPVSPPARRSPSALCNFFLTQLSPLEKSICNTKSGSESTGEIKGSRSMSSLPGRVVFLKLSVYIVVFHSKRELQFFTCCYRWHCSRISTCQHPQFFSSISSTCHASFCKWRCIEQTFIIWLRNTWDSSKSVASPLLGSPILRKNTSALDRQNLNC